MSLRVGSLFSGVEGFGQGLEAAGFEVAWQVEIDNGVVAPVARWIGERLKRAMEGAV